MSLKYDFLFCRHRDRGGVFRGESPFHGSDEPTADALLPQ